MARRMATEPKAAFAGATSTTSFAKLRPSMATFNVESLSVMAETQVAANRRGVEAVRKSLNL